MFLHKNIDNGWRDKSWFNISNILTAVRILLTPIIVYSIVNNWWKIAFFLIFIAALTDFLDGFLARLFCEQTQFGAMFDPIADKIFLVACFYTLAFVHSPSFMVPRWFVYLIMFRETLILTGFGIFLIFRSGVEVRPSIWGKLTTLFQILFIMWIFICYFMGWSPQKTYSVIIIFLALFSVFSLGQYALVGLHYLVGPNKRKSIDT